VTGSNNLNSTSVDSPYEIQPFQLLPNETSGRFIAVEGMDGCGKTTIIRKMCRELESEGYDVLRIRVPSDRMRKNWMFQVFHRQNRRSDVDPLAFEIAYMADKVQLSQNVILPALEEGKIVVSDRYLLSSVGSLLIRAPELATVVHDAIHTRPWFRDLAKDLIQPDVSFYLRADAGVAVERILKRQNERAFDIEINAYQALLDEGVAVARANGMHVIDTTHSVAAKTYEQLRPHLNSALTW
jgi:dTMP kinase